MYIPDCYQPYQQEDEDYSWKDLYSKSFHYVYLSYTQNSTCLQMLRFECETCKEEFFDNEFSLLYNTIYNKIKSKLTDEDVLRKRIDNFWNIVKEKQLDEEFIKKSRDEPYKEAKLNSFKMLYCQSLIKDCLAEIDKKFLTMGEQVMNILEEKNEL